MIGWDRESAKANYLASGGNPGDDVYMFGSTFELLEAGDKMYGQSNTEPGDDVFDTIVTLVQCFMRTSFKTKLIIILLLCLI